MTAKFLPCLLILICFGFYSKAQVKIPEEVANRIKTDKRFSSYAREMTRYLKSKKSEFPAGSKELLHIEKQEKFLARQLWYLEGRQDADGGIINHNKRTFDAFNQYQSQVTPDASATGAWSLVGPTNNIPGAENSSGIGRADRIAFHPTNPDILFAGTPSSGIFKSVNGGASWFNLNSYLPSLGVSGLVISWSNPDIIYALTGDGDSNLGENGFVQGFDFIRPSIGVLKSTDGGISWQITGELFNTDSFFVGYKLVQNPLNANILIAATSRGLYRTNNGGISWTRVSNYENRFYDIEWKPGSSTRVYAAAADTFYISNDAGATFVNQNNNLNFSWDSCSRISLAVSPANPSFLYLLAGFTNYDGNSVNKGLYKSTNSGDNLFQISTQFSLTDGLPEYMLNVAAAPNNVSIVLTGALRIYRSTNAAVTFTSSNNMDDASTSNYVHADIHDLAYNPLDNALYVACDGGVYKSTDHGVSYLAQYVGFTASQFFHFDVSTLDEDYMFAGAQDNGGLYRQGNAVTFRKMISGDGFDVKFDNGSNSQAYISVNSSLYRSDATMSNFTNVHQVAGGWFKRIVMSYYNNNIVFVSGGTIYRTLDGNISWTDVGANGRWAMATCPSHSNRIYAAGGPGWNDYDTSDVIDDKKMYRSDNLGLVWTELQNKPGFPQNITRITGIEVSPTNSSQVWITMGGFTDGSKVYYSADAGEHWINISGSIPNIPVNSVVIDANEDAYIATDIGVFYRSLSMNDWLPFYNGLPPVPVTDLHIRNGRIIASTFGRGIWVSETKGPCPPSLNFTIYVNGIKYYEALVITASNTLRGGAGTEFYIKAQSNTTLTPGFRADASTGEKFRAWIGNCGNGGIPNLSEEDLAAWETQHAGNALSLVRHTDTVSLEINTPFAVNANLLGLDAEHQVKEVYLLNKPIPGGKSKLTFEGKNILANKHLVLMEDGKITGLVTLNPQK